MKRRTCLASITSLATLGIGSGCIGRAKLQQSSNQKKTVDVSSVKQPEELTIEVDPVEKQITANSTARIALVYTNGGESVRKVNLNPDNPDPLPSIGTDPGLLLLSETYDPTQATANCWKPEEERFPQPAVVHQQPLKPGQSLSLEYDVWANPQQTADCIQPRKYQFDPIYGAFELIVRMGDPE